MEGCCVLVQVAGNLGKGCGFQRTALAFEVAVDQGGEGFASKGLCKGISPASNSAKQFPCAIAGCVGRPRAAVATNGAHYLCAIVPVAQIVKHAIPLPARAET